MNRRLLLFATTAATMAVGAGCSEDVDSSDVATDAIHANFRVTAEGDGTSHVIATLRVGGPNSNTYLDLTDYDSLVTFVNDTAKGMSQSGNAYSTSFPFEAEDTPYRVSFLRSHPPDAECAGVSAPNSTVTLPGPFGITAPAQDEMVSRGDALTFTWSNAGASDAMSWSLDGICIQSMSDTIEDDNGAFTIPADNIMVVGSANSACTATLRLYRSREGELDPNYGEGGNIFATQSRAVQFQTVE